MSFGSPQPPAPPNPYAVAAAQQQANVSVAIANTRMSNANVVSPQGTSTFAISETYTLSDPQYDADGNLVGTTDREIPVYTQTIALTATGQQIYDAHQAMQLALNELGGSQLGFLQDTLGTPFSLNDLPASANGPSGPSLNGVITQPVPVTTSFSLGATPQMAVGSNATAARDAVTATVLARLEYQQGLARDLRLAQLENMGIMPGTEAYENELRIFDFATTDGRLQAILAGGQEHTRIFAIEQAQGAHYNAAVSLLLQIAHMQARFKNDAADMDFRQKMMVIDFSNRTNLQIFQSLRAVADFINTFRERRMQEILTERNQPLNELSTMLHGGQIQIPSYTGFKAGQISDTPLGDYVYRSAAIEQQNYRTRVEQQNAMMGAMAQIGGAVLGAPMGGGASVAGSMFGGLLK